MSTSFTRLALAVSFAVAAAPCLADIYGFVDDNGVAHLSNAPLDSRYSLFMKEPQQRAAQDSPAANPTGPVASSATGTLRQQYEHLISRVAAEQGLDPALLHAVITVESGYNARAVSPKGASGLMQLMPATAKRYGVADVWSAADNITGGARYLRDLLALFGNVHLALAAYNAGEGAVIGSGNKIPPYPETRRYVPRVLQYYDRYRLPPRS